MFRLSIQAKGGLLKTNEKFMNIGKVRPPRRVSQSAHSDQHPRSPERRQHMQVEEHIICTLSWMRLEQRSECGSGLLSPWLIPALSHQRLQSSVWILLFHASIHALISPSNMLTNVFNHMFTVEGASAVSICYSNSGYQLTIFLWFNHR